MRKFIWILFVVISLVLGMIVIPTLYNSLDDSKWIISSLRLSNPQETIMGFVLSLSIIGVMLLGSWLRRIGFGKATSIMSACFIGTLLVLATFISGMEIIIRDAGTPFEFWIEMWLTRPLVFTSIIVSLIAGLLGTLYGKKLTEPSDPLPGSEISFMETLKAKFFKQDKNNIMKTVFHLS